MVENTGLLTQISPPFCDHGSKFGKISPATIGSTGIPFTLGHTPSGHVRRTMFETPPLYVANTLSLACGVNGMNVLLLSYCHCPPE